MKYILGYLLFLTNSLITSSGDDSIKLYERSIKEHISKRTNDKIHVLNCDDILLSSKIGKVQVIQSSDATVWAKEKKSLFVIKILPIQIYKDSIKIIIIDFIYTVKGGVPTLAKAGSEAFWYKYDSASGGYLLLNRVIN